MAGPIDVDRSPHARVRPAAAAITGGFWAERQRLNREVLIPSGADQLEAVGNVRNLRRAAGTLDGPYEGPVYMDSDLYKWVEAAGWDGGAERVDDVIGLIAAGQDDDGYLNSWYRVNETREKRYTNLAYHHELYCGGHLLQAAVAHARERGRPELLEVATRYADHVHAVFGPGRREGTCGHPEIEMALIELYRLTRERRYLELAGVLLDRRGHATLQPAHWGSDYYQDHAPIREQTEVVGHAVRMLYLATAIADLYLETGEPRLLEVARAQWDDLALRKSYVTGAAGSRHSGEAFGDAYELPPDQCYGETCAAIASIMFSHRLLLATGEARYADLIERTLFNGFAAGVALDGSGYFYVNPMQARGPGVRRQPWYGCACCPPNVMRLLATLQHYVATESDDELQIHQYAPGTVSGGGLTVRVATDYPWAGRVAIEVVAGSGTLALRIPGWATGATLDGEPAAPGQARRRVRHGDIVELQLPVAPRFTVAHPRIDAVAGHVAIERGPLVYCLEAADGPVDDVGIDTSIAPRDIDAPDLLGGIVAVAVSGRELSWPHAAPYANRPPDAGSEVQLQAIPYALWANRQDGAMHVWTRSRAQ